MNRHDRRAAKATSGARTVAFQLDEAAKAALIEHTNDPACRRDIDRLARAMLEWRRLHPVAALVWLDPKGVVLMGAPIDSEQARGYIAGNEDAHHCLLWADEQTGRRLTMMMVQFALVVLGWVK